MRQYLASRKNVGKNNPNQALSITKQSLERFARPVNRPSTVLRIDKFTINKNCGTIKSQPLLIPKC